jgi:hypothetical protein
MIEEEAFPFEERSIEVHEKNLELMVAGLYNPWIERSLDKLADLMPGRYAKFEISSGFLDSIDSYAYQSPAVNETAVEEISDPPPAQDSADQPPAPAQDAEAKGEEGVAEVSSADEVATAG